MNLKYLMDENVDPVYAAQLRRQRSDLIVWTVGEPNTPNRGTLDLLQNSLKPPRN